MDFTSRNYSVKEAWPAAFATIKVPGHSKLDFLEDRENYLVDISSKNTAPKGATNQISVLVQRDAPPNDNLEKLTTDAQQLAQEKENQYWKSKNYWFDEKKKKKKTLGRAK